MRKRLPAVVLFQLLLCMTPVHAEQILVAVASNFSAPMERIATEFEEQTGHEINLVFGSSGRLFAQIRNGAPFQLFFSADQEKPQQLEAAGLTVQDSRFTYVIGSLVLWSSNAALSIDGPDILDSEFKRLALANSALAPYGRAAEEALEFFNKTATTRSRWVRGENIAQTYQFVETGNADLGFVAMSQVLSDGKITRGQGWVVPSDSHSPIRQDAVQIKYGRVCEVCGLYLDFMRSPRVADIVQAYGYTVE
ncbi:MAG: molybdate ABC transporter substrate-binding protein [Pseudomonadales bacterium]|nr:molybdate ABC transporter substrate-binding protein [Pseudomonadales bacterium]